MDTEQLEEKRVHVLVLVDLFAAVEIDEIHLFMLMLASRRVASVVACPVDVGVGDHDTCCTNARLSVRTAVGTTQKIQTYDT